MNNWMKNIMFLAVIIIAANVHGQTFGNEWINYNQQYYSFNVFPENQPLWGVYGDEQRIESGIQILDYNALNESNIPLTTFSSENIQIFGREKEIPLYIVDGGDSSFDPGDYILFYTERNDGWLDSNLYSDPDDIGNSRISLYNDTLEYFFTWNNSTNNLRYLEEDNSDFTSYTPSDYIIYTKWRSYAEVYNEAERLGEGASSFYNRTEGWSSGRPNGAGGENFNLGSVQIRYPYQGPSVPNVEFKAIQGSHSNASYTVSGNHHVRWTIGASNYELADSIWIGYEGVIFEHSFPSILIPSSGESNLQATMIDDQNAVTDFQSISNFSFKYARIPNFDGENKIEFTIVNNPNEAKIRLDLSNINYNNPIVFVHGDTPKKVSVSPNGGSFTTLISNSTIGNEQHLVYQDSSTITRVTALAPVGSSGYFTDFSAIPNKEKALLMITHPELANASNLYKDYRSSSAGGNHNVISADVIELYQQFGGGINKHINGIRRYSHFMYAQSIEKPEALYLMGKGMRSTTTGNKIGFRFNNTLYNTSLISSFGSPPSDICITSGLEGPYKWVPLIPTGRISTRSDAELEDYLNKVIAYEEQQDSNHIYDSANKDWQKQVLQFTGGDEGPQATEFKNWMEDMGNIIKDSLFGAGLTTINKLNSDPFPPSTLADITDRIANGVSLMNYFGHASNSDSGFEINLDNPENWNNYGKYPVMLVNSCFNGDIFSNTNSSSEKYVQIADLGAIAYIANLDVGYDFYLRDYSNGLYQQMSEGKYGNGLADQMRKNIEIIEADGDNLFRENTCTQMTLNGDPLVKLNWHTKPEIEITESGISLNPDDILLSDEFIYLSVALTNLGRSVTRPFQVRVDRNFPLSNGDSSYAMIVQELHYKDTVVFQIPLYPNIGVGLNSFDVWVDIPSSIDEIYDEVNNNKVTATFFIKTEGIFPVIPSDFAVVPEDSITLLASTVNPIADYATYRFEIDTVDFDGTVPQSGEYRYALVSGYGGVKEVNPSEWLSVSSGMNSTLVCENDVVYFWRVSIVGDTTWRESSFQYKEGKTGWGQDHFFQFKKNEYYNIAYDKPNRVKDFSPFTRLLECNVIGTFNWGTFYNNNFLLSGDILGQGIGVGFGYKFLVAVFDPITLKPWRTRYIDGDGIEQNPGNNFGNNNDGNGANFFGYHQTSVSQLESFQNLVLNEVPDGHYILIYTPIDARYDQWNALDSVDMYNTFATLGSDSIYPGRINTPFAFLVKKGDPTSSVEEVGQLTSSNVHLETLLTGSNEIGVESSTFIGPSSNWTSIHWKQDALEAASSDTTRLLIKGYDINKNELTSINILFTSQDSIQNLNAILDASLYPYIKLEANYKDSVTFTPAQIDRWHVYYDPLPEAAIDGSNLYTWSAGSDTLVEGETVDFAIDIRNIFSVDMDSLLVNYWVEDVYHVKHPITYPRTDSLRAGNTLRDTISINTTGLAGLNSLWVEVNPYVNGSLIVTDQPEQAHFNNVLQTPFYVRTDDKNPLLDVTFDGNHILNGDIINPNSEIYITLKDDNEFLIMDNVADTSLFGIFLTLPNGTQKRIPFIDGNGNTIMQWIPANSQNKRFKIIWPAEFESDGTYSILIQGTDKSGNLSGDIDYRITFEIIHESTITNMMNYPNPFSTSTRFVFTLTGSEVPDDIIIQIMTVTGRVVREITEDQLGIIQIGRNITEYAWDGTDEFGDPLANGVYLYRVKARINGENIKHRESGADSHFNRDFGKMYILR